MKRILFLISLFVFVSVMPVYALKTMYNNEDDRRVPSRSSLFSVNYKEDYSLESESTTKVNPGRFWGDEYFRFLSQNIRPELKGTVWYYYSNEESSEQNVNRLKLSAVKNENYVKRYIREAADYFVRDTRKEDN